MSDDNKTPSGTPEGTDPMAKARAAKAAKAAAKPPEPEMEIVERKVTETTHKTTPTGQEKTKTVETTFRPKAATPGGETPSTATPAAPAASTDTANAETPEFTEAEREGIARAGQKEKRSKRPLFIVIAILVLIALAAAYVFTTDGSPSDSDPGAADAAGIVEDGTRSGEIDDDGEVDLDELGDGTGNPDAETIVAPPPSPKPTPAPRATVTPTPAPTPTPEAVTVQPQQRELIPERNMLSYVVRPYGDRVDDFIRYDFDFRRVCVVNSSGRAELPMTGCMAYASLNTETQAIYDQLCRRYYAFAEYCPADVTIDVVLREMEHHNPFEE